MPRFERHGSADTAEETVYFVCPGCQGGHAFRIRGNGPIWTWNGDVERATFQPSLLVRSYTDPVDPERVTGICHSFVRDGRIEFLSDCTHALRGQTVDVPELGA